MPGVFAQKLYLATALSTGVECQRDNIYYGLKPNQTTGDYKPEMREYLYAMKFRDENGYYKIADAPDFDPTAIPLTGSPGWTDGAFEFKLDVVLNSTNGLGTVSQSIFLSIQRIYLIYLTKLFSQIFISFHQ